MRDILNEILRGMQDNAYEIGVGSVDYLSFLAALIILVAAVCFCFLIFMGTMGVIVQVSEYLERRSKRKEAAFKRELRPTPDDSDSI